MMMLSSRCRSFVQRNLLTRRNSMAVTSVSSTTTCTTASIRSPPHLVRSLSSSATTTTTSTTASSSRKSSPPLPPSVDVVIVGGGVIGTSVAWHLSAEQGATVLLLEAHEDLTAGTTWHSAGMLWRLRPSYVDVELQTATRNKAMALQDKYDISCFTQNGGLFIAMTSTRLHEYERLAQLGVPYNVPVQIITDPTDIQAIHPLLNTDDVTGALYSPTDGTLDPAGLTTAYSKAAKQAGATVVTNVRVAQVTTQDTNVAGTAQRQVTGITTECGQVVQCKAVVNAAGCWANGVQQAAAAPLLPLRALKHAFVVTEAMEGMHGNLPNVRDHDLSIYLKAQGQALALGGYEQNPEFWNAPDPNFAFGLFDLDWDTFAQNLQGHLQRCPAVETTGIASTVCGPESFTPDHKPLVGPQAGISGLWQACGMNSMGMMLSGGLGAQLAQWMGQGAPSLDLFSYDPSRFHATTNNDAWIRQTTHESYAKTYSIVFPQDEPLAGRNVRTSALHAELAARGCVYQARHAYERPGWFVGTDIGASALPQEYDYYGAYAEDNSAWRLYDGAADIPAHAEGSYPYKQLVEDELTFDWTPSFPYVAQECHAARNGVALFDTSYFGKFIVQGPQANQAVQWMCAADLQDKDIGSVTYTPLCNARGGCEADLTVAKLDENKWLFTTGGASASRDYRWMVHALQQGGFADTTTLQDIRDDVTILSVQGPWSHALLKTLVDDKQVMENLDDFDFSTIKDNVTFAGVPGTRIIRITFCGELGFELHLPADRAAEAYRTLRAAGDELEAQHGVPIRDAGYLAMDSLSAEKSYRHWHGDLGVGDTPLEAGIGFTTLPKLKKGIPFLGFEALQAQREAGLQRRLVTLALDQPGGPTGTSPHLHGSETLLRDGIPVGLVRSTAFGHTMGRTIVTGYVNCPPDVAKITPKWLKAGNWSVQSRLQDPMPATLYLKAPFDPDGGRIQGYYEDEPETLVG